MAVAVLVATITAPLNQGALGLFNAIVAWLTANPGIHIVDATFQRLDSEEPADIQRVSLLYETGLAITGGWQARYYTTTTAGGPAANAFTTDLGLGAMFVPWFTIPTTRYKPARSTGDEFIILGVNTASDPFGFNRKNVYIAQANAAILAGAAGAATIFDGSGSNLGIKTITNVSNKTWIINQRNYVILDETTGLLIGTPTCDAGAGVFTPPASTTTTAFPLPAYFPQTPPVTIPPVAQ
jgi:hypothetical protein